MPCYRPLEGFRSRYRNPSGKRGIVFNRNDGYVDQVVKVPCGQCIGCRLERSRQWAIRCVQEASLHSDNCFLTLTYRPDAVPSGGSLVKTAFPAFMKRLRSRFPSRKISYFHCGEYGENTQRPHYHALLFGFDFPDKQIFKRNVQGNSVYTSDLLNEIWGLGFCSIGDVNFETAAYTARYVLKKVTGKAAGLTDDCCPGHYATIDEDTGEITNKQPEFITMSLKPAIGKLWFEKYQSDVFPSDSVVIRGLSMSPPKYYLSRYELTEPEIVQAIKLKRIKLASKHKADNTPSRLRDREVCKNAQISTLSRKEV